MNSTTQRIVAELQYARRTMLSSALRKLSPTDRHKIINCADQLYRMMVQDDPKINKTDILRLLASIGAFSMTKDPNFVGSS